MDNMSLIFVFALLPAIIAVVVDCFLCFFVLPSATSPLPFAFIPYLPLLFTLFFQLTASQQCLLLELFPHPMENWILMSVWRYTNSSTLSGLVSMILRVWLRIFLLFTLPLPWFSFSCLISSFWACFTLLSLISNDWILWRARMMALFSVFSWPFITSSSL